MVERRRSPQIPEAELSPSEIGSQFIERWFTPELIAANEATLPDDFSKKVGNKLKKLQEKFIYPSEWQRWKAPSVLNLGNLYDASNNHQRDDRGRFNKMFRGVVDVFDLSSLYPETGAEVALTPSDFLVTTRLQDTAAHAEEARQVREHFDQQGAVDYYYRKYHPYIPPTDLRIGSKLLYVDQRKITGFAAVTGLHIASLSMDLEARMSGDTWRWIDPIFCDYETKSPPQGSSSRALRHSYLTDKNITSVSVAGEWLDEAPQR